jgi:polyhydroxyalkanoate synthesis regulator phasin
MPTVKKAPSEDSTSVSDQLRRFLNPLEVMVITRERLQDTLDDAVQRGRMTRDDAADLLTDILRRSRRQTEDMLADLEGIVEGTRRGLAAPVERVRRTVRVAPGAFPIDGYDDLTAAKIVERLPALEPGDLRRVGDYERRNANRKTVLAAVSQRLGQ